MSPPVVDVFVGGRRFRCEVAVTDLERRKGLQGRRHLPDDAGMLFVFAGASTPLAFSMEDTFVPLDIIFFDGRGTVTKVSKGEPRSKQMHVANACGVLEVCAGSGIKVGQQLIFRERDKGMHYTNYSEGLGQSRALAAKAAAIRAALGPLGPAPATLVPMGSQSPEDVAFAAAFVDKLMVVAGEELKPDEILALRTMTKDQIRALVEDKEKRGSLKAPLIRAAFEYALAVVAGVGPSSTGGGSGGSGDTEKKFPVVPVAIGAAALAAILLMRKK